MFSSGDNHGNGTFFPYPLIMSMLSSTDSENSVNSMVGPWSSSSSTSLSPLWEYDYLDGSGGVMSTMSSPSSTMDLFSSNDSTPTPTTRISPMNATTKHWLLHDGSLPLSPLSVTASSRNFIITYCILFIVGAVGNLSVFVSVAHELWRKCHRSRIKVLILHLSLADLFVIFFVIPIEVFWRITIHWNGGDVLCKICQFFRAFGLYLSSNVIICISLDRFYVIISPLKVIGGMRRVKNMLILAWALAILFAAPQSFVFSAQPNPVYTAYEQCVTYDFFESVDDEIQYNMLSVSLMYFAPLIVILFTYVGVLIKVTRRSREHQNISELQHRILQQRFHRPSGGGPPVTSTAADGLMISSRILLRRTFARSNGISTATTAFANGAGNNLSSTSGSGSVGTGISSGAIVGATGLGPRSPPSTTMTTTTTTTTLAPPNPPPGTTHRRGSQFLRMSDAANSIGRTRRQAFVLTMIIVTVFVICWTPYVFMTLWYMLDWEGAQIVDARLKDAFFIMAVSNSCLNPLIYGNYMRRCYYTCFARQRANPMTASEEQRSGPPRDSCDIGQF